jgi:DNA-binding protein HU-beta
MPKTVVSKKAPAKVPSNAPVKTPSKKLTKTEIIRHISESLEMPTKQVGSVFTALSELAVKETKKNGDFIVPGFGKLVKVQRAARMGRNPATGEAIKIKAKTTVKFRLSKSIKDAITPPKK